MKASLVVFLKEVRENLRDRRTVINTLLTGPLMAPLIFVILINTMITRELDKADKPLPLPVVGAENAPNLIAALKQNNVDVKPAPDNPERAVREQDADVVLRIPKDFDKSWDKGEPTQVELVFDQSQRDARSSVDRLRGLLDAYSQRGGAMRLLARGLSPSIIKPLSMAERDQSTPQSRSSTLFAMLPYFFILGCFVGGMALAIDTTAGERERQSLEPLLANPAPRWQIVIGKLGATTAFAITTVIVSILAFSVVGKLMPTEKIGMSLEIGMGFIPYALIAMLPLAALLATLQTIVAAFAKSYREAQTYVSLIMFFVSIIPTMILTFLPIKQQFWMYMVPLMSQQMTITRLLRGDYVPMSGLVVGFVCTSLAVAILAVLTVRIYRSERLAISV
jgi:sodium transport system permease protein